MLDVDQQLASTFAGTVKVVLAMSYVDGKPADDPVPPMDHLQKFKLPAWQIESVPGAHTIYAPVELLSKRVGGIGFVATQPDTNNHSHRYPLVLKQVDSYFASFESIMAARNLSLSAGDITAAETAGIRRGSRLLNTDRDYAAYRYFYSAPEKQSAFRSISIVDLLNNKIDHSELRNKIVILGLTAKPYMTTESTPAGRNLPPIEIAAHTLSDANYQLGQSFQGQGQLDQAFERFKLCEIDQRLLGQLYNLGLDYERKRQFNKAISVFKFIRGHQPNYNDVSDRIMPNKQASEAVCSRRQAQPSEYCHRL